MAKGGKQPGAGRPKGAQNKATLEQKAVSEGLNQRIMKHVDNLFDAQYSLAVGSVRVFRVEEVGTGKDKKRVHELVSDVTKIKQVLDETEAIEGGGTTIDNKYYFVSHVLPDNKAIDSMLNRALGKPKDSIDVKHEGIVTLEVEWIDRSNDHTSNKS